MHLPFEGNVYLGAVVGFVAVLATALVLNELGNSMFRRGVAMPFFLGRRRLHHRQVLYYGLPAAYATIATLFFAGYITVVWSLFWTGLVTTALIAASCLLFDLTLDYIKGKGRWGYLHHELVYLVVPAYVFTDFLRVVV